MKNLSVLIGIISLFVLSYTCALAQDMKKGIEYKYNVDAIKQAPCIVWYGWDMFNSHMLDYAKFQQGELIIGAHIPAILAELEKTYTVKRIISTMKKDSVILDMISIQDLYQNIPPSKFIAHRNVELSIDSLMLIVKNYKLPQKEGLGAVIIVEMFNKPDRYVSGYITFFDIATKEVYYATKMKGLPGSKWGFNDYWFNGLTELYDYFVKYYYPKTILK